MSDYDELEHRLIVLLAGRLAASYAIGHLVTHMRYLDIAVEDYDVASRELREAARSWHLLVTRSENLAEAVEAGKAEREVFAAAGLRFHYRLDCAYTAARRVLDSLSSSMSCFRGHKPT